MIKSDTIKAKYSLIKSRFDERGRRQWAAIEAKSIGRGGISLVSAATGLSRTTVTYAIKEIEGGEGKQVGIERIRRVGGGRKRLTEKEPKLLESFSIVRLGNCERAPMLFFEIMNICLMTGRSW